ncbi:DUF2855 family protein [Actinospongicola halichondriae]|uniref:DUF2855 family protein n=1 Tax=Actinospongicola halichondriae TaxID=3236844 RepID=UPI003D3EDDEE
MITPESDTVLEVDRNDVSTTRLVDVDLAPLAPGEVRAVVERFAVTANTITYAVAGDMLGYWDFHPTELPWGRVPAMGWASVVESANPAVEPGGRYFGWFPMAGYVTALVAPTASGLRDDGPHRQQHAAVYRAWTDTRNDPDHPGPSPDDPDIDAEDRHALLRGLFLTGFLADEFFADASYHGAESVVVLSASSKTAIGFAQNASTRGAVRVVGVTSAANADFVRSVGSYDDVVTYDDLSGIDGGRDAVVIDMAGNRSVLAAVHERLGDHLQYSMAVGMSHHDAPPADIEHGPAPQMFFAPSEIPKRVEAWGSAGYQERTAAALEAFVESSRDWLRVERSHGPEAAERTWHDVAGGTVPPDVGRIVSMHED